MSKSDSVLVRLEEARTFFANTQYSHIIKEADRYFRRGELGLCLAQLGRLPSAKELLAELVERLKGKSVYKTLERAKRNGRKGMVELKALSSLLTHAVIECEKGRLEYRRLIPLLLERLNDVGFGILSEKEKTNE